MLFSLLAETHCMVNQLMFPQSCLTVQKAYPEESLEKYPAIKLNVRAEITVNKAKSICLLVFLIVTE